jgi:hypothetical protein
MLAPFLTAIIAGAVPEDPPRILGDPPQYLVNAPWSRCIPELTAVLAALRRRLTLLDQI